MNPNEPTQTAPAKNRPPAMRPALIAPLAMVFTAFALVGCSSSKPAGASFASVVITNQPTSRIQAVTESVFHENGYVGAAMPDGRMTFEKTASRGDQFAYSGLIDEGPVKVRVMAEVVQFTDTGHRLQCTAYMVRNAGDTLFEEKQRLSNLRRGPFQKMLDKVRETLNPKVVAVAAP